jgi:hypothetical protein
MDADTPLSKEAALAWLRKEGQELASAETEHLIIDEALDVVGLVVLFGIADPDRLAVLYLQWAGKQRNRKRPCLDPVEALIRDTCGF